MIALLDSNVLIALAVKEHQHHRQAQRWLADFDGNFATCPITEGALMRQIIRSPLARAYDARDLLSRVAQSARHAFWPDDVSYLDVPVANLIGHKQVTDAYLAQLARRQDARLATFDRGLASLHSDVADLVPTS